MHCKSHYIKSKMHKCKCSYFQPWHLHDKTACETHKHTHKHTSTESADSVSAAPEEKIPQTKTLHHLSLSVCVSVSLSLCLSLSPGALQIERSEEMDQGKYECVASNSQGVRYSSPANLYVRGMENSRYSVGNALLTRTITRCALHNLINHHFRMKDAGCVQNTALL